MNENEENRQHFSPRLHGDVGGRGREMRASLVPRFEKKKKKEDWKENRAAFPLTKNKQTNQKKVQIISVICGTEADFFSLISFKMLSVVLLFFFLLWPVKVFIVSFFFLFWNVLEIPIVWKLFAANKFVHSLATRAAIFSNPSSAFLAVKDSFCFAPPPFRPPRACFTAGFFLLFVLVWWSTFPFHLQVKCPCETCYYIECKITLRLLRWKCFSG